MLLHYVWIKDYLNIKEQGFHFTDEYSFSYDKNPGKLFINKNKNHIPNFFGENILSVTGVIGENGSGKSNLLNFIRLRLASFSRGGSGSVFYDDTYEAIFIFDNNIYCHSNLALSVSSDLKRSGFNIFYYNGMVGLYDKLRRKKHPQVSYDDNIYSNRYLYYSNIFNIGFCHYEIENFDISTNNFIANAGNYFNRQDYSMFGNKVDRLSSYMLEETSKQIQFVYNFQSDKNIVLPFALPSELTIAINERNNNIDKEFFEKNKLDHLKDILSHNHYSIPKTQKEKAILFKKLFQEQLFISLLLNYSDRFKDFSVDNYYEFKDNGDTNSFKMIYDGVFLRDINKIINSLDKILKHVRFPDQEMQYSKDLTSYFEKYGLMWVEIHKLNFKDLNEFIGLSYSFMNKKPFLEFSWEGFSSGELNMLTLYSRFYFASVTYFDDKKNDPYPYNHIIVMIDEGETYFHPKWQTEYLNDVINCLKVFFRNKTLQVIITSNSPFIASDIPKSMINFLSKDANGNCMVVGGLNGHKETFGANIHTLYTDAFFMPTSLMGTFAKQKIMKLISIINDELDFDPEFPDLDTVESYINIVGEPILKTQLKKQLDSLRLKKIDEIDSIKSQMRNLNKRLKRLEEGEQ